jgi:ketosteroid isomerase-like protein
MPTAAITTVLDDWKEAERTGDAERLGELLTDDFVGIGPVGFVLAKDAWLGRFGPDLHYEELDLDEVSVRNSGDTTIVVAHQHATGEARGNPIPADTRVSFVMVADGGRRRIVGIQYSFIAPVS